MKPKYGQLLIWTLVFFLLYIELNNIAEDGIDEFLARWGVFDRVMLALSSLLTNIAYALVCYTGLFWLQRKHPVYILALVLLAFLFCAGMRYGIEEVLYLHWFGFDNYYDTMTTMSYLLDNLYYAIPFSAVGMVFYFQQESRYREQQQKELLIHNQKTELAFLRSQLNPHFLFNTLNNVYTLVYQKSDKALQAMQKLTALLRYALYEPQERVPLQKEIRYIEDFIALQRLRYDYEVQLELSIAPDIEGLHIPPFALIPFVENAFKHGELRQDSKPLRISMEILEEAFLFRVVNVKRPQQKDTVGGIGLANIKKRLSLIYQDEHDLQIDETADTFLVELKIPLYLCSNA